MEPSRRHDRPRTTAGRVQARRPLVRRAGLRLGRAGRRRGARPPADRRAREREAAGRAAAEVYLEVQRSAAFQEVRSRYRRFVVPAAVGLPRSGTWRTWSRPRPRPELMARPVAGAVNVAMVAGLGQFLTTFLLTWAYARHARLRRDRAALELRWDDPGMTRGAAAGGDRRPPDAWRCCCSAPSSRSRSAITTWVSRNRQGSAEEFYAGGRLFSPMENGFAIAGDYMSAASFLGISGLIALFGYDGLLYSRRLPRGLAGGAVPRRRTGPQLRPVHPRRRRRGADERAPGADRGGNLLGHRVRALSGGADGRRGQPGRAAARTGRARRRGPGRSSASAR